MNITVIHGQSHKGITYTMTQRIIDSMMSDELEIREFFLPNDGPGFCIGCNSCFLKGENSCPGSDKVQPVAKAMDWADIILLDSPNYVMEMSGLLKNLMDHLAYRWITHRPSGAMFQKVGITVCSSAGAPCGHTTRSMAKQLKWMCVPTVYTFPLVSNAMKPGELKPKKVAELNRKAEKIARKALKRALRPRAGIRSRIMFFIFRGMQSSPKAAWNPADRDWWIRHGWTANIRPWKS